jgi:RNA polymerase sigma factor (TIGR02999 family)
MSASSTEVTTLLQQWSDGDRQSLDRLTALVYERLRRLAHQRLRHEDSDLTLNTTALVHEVYLKLVDLRRVRFRDRAHFLSMASRLMRRLWWTTPVRGRPPNAVAVRLRSSWRRRS